MNFILLTHIIYGLRVRDLFADKQFLFQAFQIMFEQHCEAVNLLIKHVRVSMNRL